MTYKTWTKHLSLTEFVRDWNESIDLNKNFSTPLSREILWYLTKSMQETMVCHTGHMYDIDLHTNGRIELNKEDLDKLIPIY